MQARKIGLSVLIVIFSQILYGQSIPSSHDIFEDPALQVALITLPTSEPFSYSLIKEVTRFHFDLFLRNAPNAGWNVQVWNAVEYQNMIHALGMNTGEMLRYGDHLLASLANSNPNVLSRLLAYFLTDEKFNGKRIVGAYLQDISFESQSKTIHSLMFRIRMDDNQTTNIVFECNDDCNREIQEEVMYQLDPQVVGYSSCDDDQCRRQRREIGYNLLYERVLNYSAQGLLQSFEELLRKEGIPQGSRLTLYLKDLSQTKKVVDSFGDVERINIGVVVENSNGEFLRELDWIIPVGRLNLTATILWETIITPFHEAAHAVVRRVLFGDIYGTIYRESILIRNGLVLSNQWKLTHGYINVVIRPGLSQEMLMNSTGDYTKYMAVTLAALIADRMFLSTDRNYDYEVLQVQTLAFHGICSGLSLRGISGRDQCPAFNDLEGLIELVEKLPQDERKLWIDEAILWQSAAARLAARVLDDHFDVLEQLTDLVLLNDVFNYQDLQNFYQDFTFRYPLFSEVLNGPEEDPSENAKLSLLVDFGPDILNRRLASLFSLDHQQNLERVQRSSMPNLLSEAEKIETPPYAYLSIQGGPSHIQRNYSQGLPALFILENV